MFNAKARSRPKSPWSVAKSFFAKFKIDDEETDLKCLEFDWSCSNMEKIIRKDDERAAVYQFLTKNYRIM